MKDKNQIIYLETGDDIASLASRIKNAEKEAISFVVPRGGSIAQSVVNLKLLKREAEKAGKQVSLVTKDKISKNLASQVGLTVYQTADEAKRAIVSIDSAGFEVTKKNISGGIHINRYEKDDLADEDGELEQQPKSDPELENEIDQVLKEKDKSSEKFQIKTDSEKTQKTVSVPVQSEQIGDKKGEDKKMPKRKKIGSRKKPILIITSVFLIAALVLAYVFVPKADISIVLATEDISKDYEITIDKNISETSVDEAKVPGEEVIVEKELTKDFESTGEKEVGNKASGEITFYNYDYQSSDPKSLPAGTVLVAQNLNFITTQDVSIPGATATIVQGSIKVTPSTVKGSIEAQNPGAEYNIEASNFVVRNYSAADRENVYGQSSSALGGGTSEKKRVISADDLERAKSEIRTELSGQTLEEITERTDSEKIKVITSSFNEEEALFESNKQADEESANFKVKMILKTTAIAFSESLFRDVVVKSIEKELEEDQMLVNPEKPDIDYNLISIDNEAGIMKLAGTFSGKYGKNIGREVIVNACSGKKMGTANSELSSMDGVQEVNISIWPSFFTKVTSINTRIKVNFDYNK